MLNLNKRRNSIGFALFAFLAITGAAYAWMTHFQPEWHQAPGKWGDDVFYESIAFNLANHGEFALTFQDPNFLEPYLKANKNGELDWIENTQVHGLTTTRAPAFPYFVSWIYSTYGRDWNAIRVANLVIMAAGLTFLVVTIAQTFGLASGLIFLLTLSVDFGVMMSPGKVLTEAIGLSFLAATFAWLIRILNVQAQHDDENANSKTNSIHWLFLGFLFGVAILFRSPLIGWLLQLYVLLTISAVMLWGLRKPVKPFVKAATCFLFMATVLSLPWWARNCQQSNAFVPFGTAGTIGFVGGFSDAAFESRGNWRGDVVKEAQADVVRSQDLSEMSLPEIEVVMGKESVELGREWIKSNPDKLPLLALDKALNHLGLIEQTHPLIPYANGLLLIGALIGSFLAYRRFGFWVLLVTFLSLATTILTWSHHGRFALPLRPIWHAATAVGIAFFWGGIFRQQDKFDNDINLVP